VRKGDLAPAPKPKPPGVAKDEEDGALRGARGEACLVRGAVGPGGSFIRAD